VLGFEGTCVVCSKEDGGVKGGEGECFEVEAKWMTLYINCNRSNESEFGSRELEVRDM